LAFGPGVALNEPRETTRSVAAHVSHTAVAVIELPRPLRPARSARHEKEQTVGAHAAMPIAQPRDLLRSEGDFLRSIIDQQKIIAGSVHFRELQSHRQST
jgi:hypothetical protein